MSPGRSSYDRQPSGEQPVGLAVITHRVIELEKARDEDRRVAAERHEEVRAALQAIQLAQHDARAEFKDGTRRMNEIDAHLKATDGTVEGIRGWMAEAKATFVVLGSRVRALAAGRSSPHVRWTAIGGAGMGVILGAIEIYKAVHP